MILLHLFACTFQPGGAFATLDGATFEAALEPGVARDLSTGDALIFLTDLAYEVTVERADYIFRAVRVNAGAHQIERRYGRGRAAGVAEADQQPARCCRGN